MNSFEKYIRENKERLDSENADPASWLALENKILKQKNRRSAKLIKWITASAAVLVALVLALNYLYQAKSNTSNLLAQYGLESQAFTKEVDRKTKALSAAEIPLSRKGDFDMLLKQLAFLDDQYHDYLQYVDQNGYQEFIGEQIVNYYKTKIELLDKIQQEIEKINYYEKKYEKESTKVSLSM